MYYISKQTGFSMSVHNTLSSDYKGKESLDMPEHIRKIEDY